MSKTEDSVTEKKNLKRRVAEAEALRAEVELAQARLQLERDRLRHEETLRDYAFERAGDHHHGVFTIDGQIGTPTVALSKNLRHYGRAYPEAPITLNIFSPGGSVFHGLVLYDTLRTLSDQGHAVTTVVRGYAASMGGIIFLAGDNRLIGKESQVMIHSLSAGTGGSLHDMEDDVKFFRKLNKRLVGLYVERTKITQEMLDEETRKKDWWLSSDQALKLKVATALG